MLNSILATRIQVGLLGAKCNILNPHEKEKYPLACSVSGSHLEGRASCLRSIVEMSVCLIDSNRISYRAMENI
jgi:hypothetical protein